MIGMPATRWAIPACVWPATIASTVPARQRAGELEDLAAGCARRRDRRMASKRVHEPPTCATTMTTVAPRRRRAFAAATTVGARGRARRPAKFAGKRHERGAGVREADDADLDAGDLDRRRAGDVAPGRQRPGGGVDQVGGEERELRLGGACLERATRIVAGRARRGRGPDRTEVELVISDRRRVVLQHVVGAHDGRALVHVRLQRPLEHVARVEQHHAARRHAPARGAGLRCSRRGGAGPRCGRGDRCVPTIEIVTNGSRAAAPAPPSAARVEGATSDSAARQIALVYDARMRLFRCALAMVVMTGVGCGGRVGASRCPTGRASLLPRPSHASINRNVDILFLIDDSSSMKLAQDNLLRDFPTFMTRLQDPPGLPNLHMAVISSDMGAGDGSIAGCDSTGGQAGDLPVHAARRVHDHEPRSRRHVHPGYRRRHATTRQRSRTCSTCIAALGEAGCGFEHQFAAILRALGADGRAAPAENQGFLRPDAYLAIIMLTNEDDCSATPGVPLFDTASNTTLTSQLGPPANFRCNEFGHNCDGGPSPPRRPEQRRDRNGHVQRLHFERIRGLPAERQRHREPTQGAQGRPRSGGGHVDPGSDHPVHRELEEPDRRGYVMRRGLVSMAGDRAFVHWPPTGASAIRGYARRSW